MGCYLFAVNEDIVWALHPIRLARLEPGTEAQSAGSDIEFVMDAHWEGVGEEMSGFLVYRPNAPAGEVRLNTGSSEIVCEAVWQAAEVETEGEMKMSGT